MHCEVKSRCVDFISYHYGITSVSFLSGEGMYTWLKEVDNSTENVGSKCTSSSKLFDDVTGTDQEDR
jgi:hypothetical protein